MKLCLYIFLPAILLSSGDGERLHSSQDFPFTRAVLFERFDADHDGRLNANETRALRDEFGGVDVPLLPDEPFDYTDVDRPDWLDPEELHQTDNTPADNPTTNPGAALGRVLFYDRQLSRNNTIACASCHLQERGFADPRRVSIGFEGGTTTRNAMGLCNLRYSNINGSQPGFFWDERAATLEAQALMPIQDGVEMGMELDALEDRLQALPWYPPLFESAFGSAEVTSERIARAIAQFLRAVESWDSKFDQAAAGTDSLAMEFDEFSPQENHGKRLFFNGIGGIAEFGCAHCHIPPTFGMRLSLNNGLETEYEDAGLGARDLPPNEPFTPSNDGKFKAPSLRNIELTAPYMHDGRFDTLEEVVAHYSSGVHPHENLGLAFVEEEEAVEGTSGFGFTESQQASLVAFLRTLTDRDFVTDPKFSDPFVRLSPTANRDGHSRRASSAR
jgi:cytochrome c peroxidase